MKRYIEPICELMRSCGRSIKDVDRSTLQIDTKAGHANFVTDCDRRVQDRLMSGLSKLMPDAHFIGEEGSAQEFSPQGKYFIVDPIDGTTNFIKDFHASSISVALIVDGVTELGAVYNPYLDEMFTAMRGQGAFCNGRRINVSSEPIENGLVIFGTSPYNEELSEISFKLAYSYFKKSIDIRRTGSAALDLCSVAAGRAELFFELSLSPWDYAAGALIVEEAGGVVTDINNNALDLSRKSSVLARNKVAKPIVN